MPPSERGRGGGEADDPHLLAILKDIVDPALGINIVDFGLVYRAQWTPGGIEVDIGVPPTCPAATRLRDEVRSALCRHFPETRAVRVAVLTDKPWSLDRLTENGRRAFGAMVESGDSIDAAIDDAGGGASVPPARGRPPH